MCVSASLSLFYLEGAGSCCPSAFSLAARSMAKGTLEIPSLAFSCPGKHATSPDVLGAPSTYQEVSTAPCPLLGRSLKSGEK